MSLHPASLPPEKLLAQCRIEFVRRSGPGGQHRNKVSTGAVLTHEPTGISAEASERRSQAENREVALFRLRVQLALDIRSAASPSPSPLWRSRVGGGRIAVNAEHGDFPAMLAEALDVLASCDFEPKNAAELLQCSTSQLAKFLQKEPRAFALVNRRRAEMGKHPLV